MRNFINRKRVRDLLKKYSRSETTLEEFQELSSEVCINLITAWIH